MSDPLQLPKSFVTVFLAFVFILGFIITPYWKRAGTTSEMVFILALILVVGVVWLYVSAQDLQLTPVTRPWSFFGILLVVSLALNARALTSVIPWRGDEDFHIENTLLLMSQISTKWLLLAAVVLCIMLYVAWRKLKWVLALGGFAVLGIIIVMFASDPLAEIPNSSLFRYPFLNYWFFVTLPKLALSLQISPYEEVLFRVLPFLAAFLIAWVCQLYFLPPRNIADLLWGVAVATIPLLFYYASILYLELPAVLLMVLVCMGIDPLLKEEPKQLKRNPFWYALLLIGFIKETTIPFLLLFLFWRWVGVLIEEWTAPGKPRRFTERLMKEIPVALAVLLPALLFYFLRTWQTKNRGFSPELANLTDVTVLQAIGRSFVEQLGLFLILFLIGCLMLLRRRDYLPLGFLVSMFLAYPLFFALNTARFAGYSRFNLFILAPVLAASVLAIRELLKSSRGWGPVLAGFVLLANLWASPLHWDGTKEPFWGNSLADTSEHYYPYEEALQWLKTNHGDDRILFTGMHYPYRGFSFYFSRLKWAPAGKILLNDNQAAQTDRLSASLAEAASQDFDVVLFQVKGSEIPQLDASSPFVEEKVFQNDAHALVVYSLK